MKTPITGKSDHRTSTKVRGTQTAAFNVPLCHCLNDWSELRHHLVQTYGLEEVSIGLQSDFVRSGSFDTYGSVEVTEIAAGSVLLSISMGLRSCLGVHLLKGDDGTGKVDFWRPRSEYEAILSCAKELFSRVVRDRMVELMSQRVNPGVVSFFFDEEGNLESASGKAAEFCRTQFEQEDRENEYFPISQWAYIQGAIQFLKVAPESALRGDSMVFCFQQDRSIVNCLLQKMGSSGYLLSLSLEREIEQ